MKKYLSGVSRSGLNKPDYLTSKEFLHIDALLLDNLVEDSKGLDGCRSIRSLRSWSCIRGREA